MEPSESALHVDIEHGRALLAEPVAGIAAAVVIQFYDVLLAYLQPLGVTLQAHQGAEGNLLVGYQLLGRPVLEAVRVDLGPVEELRVRGRCAHFTPN